MAVVPDLKAERALVADLLKSANPAKVALGKRMSLWLDVASATTRAERHAAIQRLPVKAVLTAPTEGRAGVLKTFVAGGKVRASRFIAVSPAPLSASTTVVFEAERAGGPSESVMLDGRWKSDGNGGCYWDASDSGSNQCTPPGRWKIGAECYWDMNDSGPDQCTPPNPTSTCYFDGAPADCATQQDIDDALTLVASATAEVEQAQAEAAAAWAQLEAYCNQNPQNCQQEGVPISGPSCNGFMPCLGEWGQFAGAAIGTNGAIAVLASVALAPAAPALAVAGAAVVVVGGLWSMFGTSASLLSCIERTPKLAA